MRNNLKNLFCKKAFKVINAMALYLAVLSVNSTCVWVCHQPRIPKRLMKMNSNGSSDK